MLIGWETNCAQPSVVTLAGITVCPSLARLIPLSLISFTPRRAFTLAYSSLRGSFFCLLFFFVGSPDDSTTVFPFLALSRPFELVRIIWKKHTINKVDSMNSKFNNTHHTSNQFLINQKIRPYVYKQQSQNSQFIYIHEGITMRLVLKLNSMKIHATRVQNHEWRTYNYFAS